MEPTQARAVLEEGCSILRSLNLRYWLSSGTALGWHRDGLSDEFLRKDSDLDVDVEGEEHYPAIKAAFESAGFKEFDTYLVRGRRARVAFTKSDIILDIYFFFREGDRLINWNEYGSIAQPACMTDSIGKGDWPTPVWAVLPKPADEYLDLRYGSSWRSPSPMFEWAQETAALVPWRASIAAIEPRAYYHIAAMNHWREVVVEQLDWLARVQFPGLISVGFLGWRGDEWFVREAAAARGLRLEIRFSDHNYRLFEKPTLALLEKDVRSGVAAGPVLYFHTKGASKPGHSYEYFWRRLMGKYCLIEWAARCRDLEIFDAAGVDWLDCSPREHFSGTFWWARADWVAKLSGLDWYWNDPWYDWRNWPDAKDPVANKRYAAEQWISSNNLRRPERAIRSLWGRNEWLVGDDAWRHREALKRELIAL